ncbi:SKP1-like protein 8 [Arabidopsis thaliana]|uniref:SKP1-like protein 7 n=4 Tax=Arabidopsis TaxID=3701 RepID=ASK7_ARATH|nr:SKP1-like 7 [Arabidopsis thaliana]Q9LSY0.1 RecName: Full=SKP1-like protein 7; Short=AtSK7 [Arabidopsis thaliana]KAG7626132.1 SKP1/BTB/POZ domain superfamily [Arabidopsis thaliana x Arabidopsis arenosa]KAG7632123.1 SKP1/BTB/POZ domain superfamily [Arabidopsis suecica]AEE76557.1 SKP1-like 7 [Arabidopsis thaliana]OAP03387.1 SK7 [Arabidopsis thaliana]CAA0383246.1 unnamed protein product [Arabidopsis thaliana]|eukprot:NP_566693.1 SKP1-like 7 [Arabidopsis thaliana]
MSTKKIMLKSSDGKMFEIEEETARQCQTIAHMIEAECTDNVIPVSNVTSEILEMVIEYCNKHHVDAANPCSDEDLKKWDKEFMEKDQYTIFHLMNAAYDLHIKSLLALAYQTVADMVNDNKWAFE